MMAIEAVGERPAEVAVVDDGDVLEALARCAPQRAPPERPVPQRRGGVEPPEARAVAGAWGEPR